MYSLVCSVAGSSSSSPNLPKCSSPRESALVFADHLRSHFSLSQPKAPRSRAKGYLPKLYRASCPEDSHSSFFEPFSPAEFFAAARNFFLSTATDPEKVAYFILKCFFRSAMDFLHIFNLFGLCISFLPSERHLPLFSSIK